MKASGYIAVHRTIFDHPMFKRRDDWFKAWQWLLASAAWKPEGRRNPFGVVHLERGQLVTTLRDLGKTWGWPKSSVDRFLKRLAREDMVVLQKTGTRSGTRTGTLAHPMTLITICNYERFQKLSAPRENPGQEAGQEAGQGIQKTLPLQGFSDPEPTNQLNKDSVGVDKSGEKGQASKRSKPAHGAKGRGMVWFDHGTPEWQIYADDFKATRGAEKLPETREGGRGNWFKWLGEAAQPLPQRGFGRKTA